MTGFFKAVLKSFYSPAIYQEVAQEKRGIGARFIVVSSVIISLASIAHSVSVSAYMDELLHEVPAVTAAMPAMTVKDDKLSIDKPVPYEIRLNSSPDTARVVIDTNYKLSDISALQKKMKQEKIVMLVTSDAFAVIGNNDAPKITGINDFWPFAASHTESTKSGQALNTWIVTAKGRALSGVVGFLGFFLNGLFLAAFFAILVALTGKIAGIPLKFCMAMRLVAFTFIPATVLAVTLSLVGLDEASITAIGCLLCLGYIIFAVVSCRALPQPASPA